VSNYEAVYEKRFVRNLKHYLSLQNRIKRRCEQVMSDPYTNTEFLGDVSGKLNLVGCRSIHIDRNFRIIFVVCEECRHIPKCNYCFCDDLSDKTIVFLTVGSHDKAYAMK